MLQWIDQVLSSSIPMKTSNSYTRFSLGYLAHIYDESQRSFIGGLLVTDLRGIPSEFRHTEAIRPSGLQQTLYAEALEPYLGSEVIGPTLIASLEIKPSLILIDAAGLPLFEAIGEVVDVPVSYLERETIRETEQNKMVGSAFSPNRIGKLVHGNFIQPHEFIVKGKENSPGYAYPLDVTFSQITQEVVDIATKSMDVFSPFTRVRNALYAILTSQK